MADKKNLPAKQPHLAWRIARVALHILGKITLWGLVIAATVAVIAAVSGSIFMTKFSEYLKTDVIPKAEEYAENLDLDSISLELSLVEDYQDNAYDLLTPSTRIGQNKPALSVRSDAQGFLHIKDLAVWSPWSE